MQQYQFVDTFNRTWNLAITLPAVKIVRDKLGVDLAKLDGDQGKPLGALLSDPVKFVDVLFLLVQDQAKTANVTLEQFMAGFAGDALEAAEGAFLKALADFMPPARRKLFQQIIAKEREFTAIVVEATSKRIDSLDLAEEAEAFISSIKAGTTPAA